MRKSAAPSCSLRAYDLEAPTFYFGTPSYTVSIDDLGPIGSRTWAFQRTHYWTPKIQDGGDPPFWMLTRRQYAKTRFSQKLSNLVSCNWAFQITHYWIPKIQDG